VSVTDFHQTPLEGEAQGQDYDVAGIITDEWLVANTPVGEADYYMRTAPVPASRGFDLVARRRAVRPNSLRIFRPGGRTAGSLME
jgi:hypothetical protein